MPPHFISRNRGPGALLLCVLTACSSGVSETANALPAQAPTSASPSSMSPSRLRARAAAAAFYGCPVFTAGNTYNAPVNSSAIDPHSSAYISSMQQAGDTAGFYASTGYEKANQANDSTPMLTVHPKVSYHSFPATYPWASTFYIEKLSDAHAIVVQTQSCHVYEAYSTTYSGGKLSAYSGANWNLTKPFVPLPKGQPSAMASGLSLFAGLVRWEDYQSGSINHALNWAAVAHTVSKYGFVSPASDTDGLDFSGTSSYQLPYGARLRLHASFSTAGWGPQATMVANAMKTYGIYLADTGSSGNALYFGNASNGTNPWNSSDLSSLSKIRISDFDVIALPVVQQAR